MGLPYAGILNFISSRLISSLILISVLVTILTVFISLILKCNKPSSKLKHAIWFLLILSFLIIPLVSRIMPEMRIPITKSEGSSYLIPPPERITSETKLSPSNPTRPVDQPVSMVNPSIKLSTISIILFIWLTGIILFLLKYLYGWYRVRKIIHAASPVQSGVLCNFVTVSSKTMGIKRSIRIYQSGRCSKPFTYGVIRPKIFFPLKLPRDTHRSVILHELAHIKRFDYLTQTISYGICILFWFLPTSWFLLSRKQLEQENSSDEIVVKSGVKPITFAENLITFARYSLTGCIMGVIYMAGKNLEIRIKNLLSLPETPAPSKKTAKIKWLILCSFLLILPLSSIQPIISGTSKAFYLGDYDQLSVLSHMIGNKIHFRINRWDITGSLGEQEIEYDYEDRLLPKVLGVNNSGVMINIYSITITSKSNYTQKETEIKNSTTAEIITKYGFGTVKTKEILKYDQNGNIQTQSVYDNNENLLLSIKYKYQYNRRVSADFYDSSGILISRRLYRYDPYKINKLVRVEQHEKYKPVRYYDIEYKKGQAVQLFFYEEDDLEAKLMHYIVYEYDQTGNKHLGFLYSPEGNLIRRFVYAQ